MGIFSGDASGADRPGRAAALMLGALLTLGLQDGIVRMAEGETALWQFQVIRSALNLALLAALSRVLYGGWPPWPRRPWAVALRCALLVVVMTCFFGGVPTLSMAEMAAGLYTFPVFVTLISGFVFSEAVGLRRIAAVLVAAAGAALILEPWQAEFRAVALLPVAAGLGYAGVVITTRQFCREEAPATLVAAIALTLLITGSAMASLFTLWSPPEGMRAALPFLTRGWGPVTAALLGFAAAASVLNVLANLALARAYQSAESSWLAPFDYAYLGFATFWGWVLFAERPGTQTLAGMALIAGAGLFTAWRERVRGRRVATPGPARR